MQGFPTLAVCRNHLGSFANYVFPDTILGDTGSADLGRTDSGDTRCLERAVREPLGKEGTTKNTMCKERKGDQQSSTAE